MFKFALAAAISMMLMFEPAVAEAKSKSKSRAAAVKRVKAKRAEPAKLVAREGRGRVVRRVVMANGKRKVVYQTVRRTAPALAILPPAILPA